jgi:uncharacterized RDD family membrane protein YckC
LRPIDAALTFCGGRATGGYWQRDDRHVCALVRNAAAGYDVLSPRDAAPMSTDMNNQYAPPKSVVADVGVTDVDSDKASRWSRLGASMIDGFVVVVGLGPSYYQIFTSIVSSKTAALNASKGLNIWLELARTGTWFYLAIIWLLLILAVNIYLMRRNGQTIGKKLVGIKVVRVDGSPVSLSRNLFLRYFCNLAISMVPGAGSVYSLIDSLMIFGKERRCIHDYMADTIVINA